MRLYVKVTGHVQGIGYRYFVIQTARKLSLTGWVRNCSNGDVELEAQGESTHLQNFIALLKRGHAWARVEQLTKEDLAEKPEEKGFEIRF